MNIIDASKAALEAQQFAELKSAYIRSTSNPDMFVCIPRPDEDDEGCCEGIETHFRDGSRCIPGLLNTIQLFALDWEVADTDPGTLSPEEVRPMSS